MTLNSKKIEKKLIFFTIFAVLALSGCQSMSLFSSPVQNRGMTGFFKDNFLRAKIIKALARVHTGSISCLINKGNVLILGYVPTENEQQAVLEQLSGMTEIVQLWNYIVVGKAPDDPLDDTYISQTLQAILVFDVRIRAQNYHISASHKVVYILGSAESEQEKQYVIEHAEAMKVRRVICQIVVDPASGGDVKKNSA
jgi:osmotically-inducible protein OsmY